MDAVWAFLATIWAYVMANPNLAMLLFIGLVAGYVAGLLLGGGGLLRNLFIGVIGAFIGGYLQQIVPSLTFGFPPLAEQIAFATIGAMIVVLLARIIAR